MELRPPLRRYQVPAREVRRSPVSSCNHSYVGATTEGVPISMPIVEEEVQKDHDHSYTNCAIASRWIESAVRPASVNSYDPRETRSNQP